jgi:hypothetical protein
MVISVCATSCDNRTSLMPLNRKPFLQLGEAQAAQALNFGFFLLFRVLPLEVHPSAHLSTRRLPTFKFLDFHDTLLSADRTDHT